LHKGGLFLWKYAEEDKTHGFHAGQVFDKECIYEALWGYDSKGDSSVVAEHIRRIRDKLEKAGAENKIESVWGVGYKWQSLRL